MKEFHICVKAADVPIPLQTCIVFSFKTKASLISQSHIDYLLNTGIRDACRLVLYTRIHVYMAYTHVVFRYVCELVGI